MVPPVKPSLLPARSLGAREVRALAHPLRLRLLESLGDGPATASMLARELGESSGATSYHLRALAAAGLIVEDFERRKGRERWWKREPSRVGLISSAPAEDPEYDAAVAQLESTMLGRDEDAIRRYIHARSEGEHSRRVARDRLHRRLGGLRDAARRWRSSPSSSSAGCATAASPRPSATRTRRSSTSPTARYRRRGPPSASGRRSAGTPRSRDRKAPGREAFPAGCRCRA